MCGICGVYAYCTREPARAQVPGNVLASFRQRGPDDEGMHLDADVGLGSRRLSIKVKGRSDGVGAVAVDGHAFAAAPSLLGLFH